MRPLEGIVVLDFSVFLAGPAAALRLADLGAHIIKVERPDGGDLCRHLYISNLELDGDSTLFHSINRNKESFSANLKNPADMERVKKLIARADVMIQNFRPGVMERLGLDYAAAAQINPRLVYAAVTGYGNEGPWRDKPGQDLLAQSLSGVTWLSGDGDGPPVPMGLAVADMFAAAFLTQGILACLVRRGVTGKGGLVETSLLESLLDFQFEVLTTHLNDGGKTPVRANVGNAQAYLGAPYGIYQTADGYLAIAMNPLEKIGGLIDLPGLGNFDRSETFARRDEIKTIIADRIAQQSTAHWLALLEPADVWCAEVMDWPKLLRHEAFKVLQMTQTVSRPGGPSMPMLRCPVRIDGERLFAPKGSPKIGQDNARLLEEFGLCKSEANHRMTREHIPSTEGPGSRDAVALELRGITKRYPGTLALDGVALDVRAGEVHAILGENGAGKSTLVKLIAGAFKDYEGDAFLNGARVELRSPVEAKRLGIEMIHQELSLARPLSVAENILAGRLPVKWGLVDRRAMRQEAKKYLERVGLSMHPDALVCDLSQHEAQLVEIAKALANEPRILVMDEPTSALSRAEVERLFGIVNGLRRAGLAILYISHHLPELKEIADRVTVLRDGRKVGTYEMRDVTSAKLVELMVGRSVTDLYAKRQNKPGDVRLRLENLSRWGFFHNVSLDVRRGEILGIGGLSGAGRSELARSICGIDPVDEGEIWLEGTELCERGYDEAIREGFAYLTEDRKQEGLALRMESGENLLAAVIGRLTTGGVYARRRGQGTVLDYFKRLQVYPAETARTMANFSGGNQQKVLLAKWLATRPKVLFLDEPTRGVDVGAKVVIHRAIAEAADAGVSIILLSSDLPELVGLSDRILILRKGKLLGELEHDAFSEEGVLLAANGEGRVRTP